MDKRCLTFVSMVVTALFAAPAVLMAAKPPTGPSTDALIARAKAAIADGTVVPSRDLAPLLERLAASRNEFEQGDLIDDIETWGRYDGAYPAAVKAYLRDAAPPVLLAVARGKATSLVRGNALMAVGALHVSDSLLDEAIAIAQADPDQMVQFKGSLMKRGKERRQHPVVVGGAPAAAAAPTAATNPTSPAKEQAALEFLRGRRERVSADTLGQAALHADTDVVVALLDAGVDVNATTLMGTPLDYALGPGCVADRASPEARLATIDALIQHGADVKREEILMTAVECPVAVVAHLVAAGASVDTKNPQGFSPLQNAFMRGKWEVAELLVDHGARVTKKQINEIFSELPSDPRKLALIKRATVK
jgi:hypothetical protein